MINKYLLLTGLFLLGVCPSLLSQNQEINSKSLSLGETFKNPPASAKPHVYWYWVSNNISREGIRKDLEAMAKIGIGGVNIAQIGYKDSPVGKVTMFSDEWWNCLTLAMEEAARLGIEVSLFNSPGWSGTGGAWVKPEQAMRYLDLHEYRVKGPRKLVMQLPDYVSKERVPQSSLSFQYEIDKSTFKFQQVGVQAFPAPKGSGDLISGRHPLITSDPQIEGVEAMFDGDEATKTSLYSLPVSVELNLKESMTVRSLEIVPADIPFSAWCRLEYQTADGEWKKVVSRRINRGEIRIIASGFLPFAPVSQSFPAASSKKFRITFSENETGQSKPTAKTASKREEKGRIAEIRLTGAVQMNNYAEKQLGNKAAYDKGGKAAILPDEDGWKINKEEVLDLISHVDQTG